MKSVTIIGCGKLGLYAAKTWPSFIKIQAVTKSPIVSCNFSNLIWHQHEFQTSSSLLKNEKISQTLVQSRWVNFWLPPSTPGYINALRETLSQLGSKQLFTFISSTSVFGSKNRTIDESSHPDPESDNAKILVEAEQYIKKTHKRYHIIRPAGLLDELRHPVFTLSSRKNLSEGNFNVNLIHSFDVVSFIKHLACHKKFTHKNIETNLASYTHLPKSLFYERSATKRNISKPEFLNQDNNPFDTKIIDSSFLWPRYQYQLKYLHVD